MSRLNELIAELCPDGVEYKQFSDVIRRNREKGRRFPDITKVYAVTNNLGIIASDEYDRRDVSSSNTGNYGVLRAGMFAYNPSRIDVGSIGMLPFGSEPGLVSPLYVVFSVIDESLDLRYVEHFIASAYTKNVVVGRLEVGARNRFDFENWKYLHIPVPPIEVQREIVRILDSFQELDNSLTAEIEARERQFEWMLQEELSISHLARVESNAVEMRAVRDIREKVITPIRAKPADFEGTIPWCKLEDVVGYEIGDSLSGKNVSEETVVSMGLNVYPEGTVLCSCSATLGVYCVTQKPLVTNQRFMGFICSDEVLNRFFMYAMDASTTKLLMQATTGTNAYISRKAFEDHLIPVPTIGVQKRVVEELDSAYHLLNSLRSMREARRKQFAYYRDKLLDLPEKVPTNG